MSRFLCFVVCSFLVSSALAQNAQDWTHSKNLIMQPYRTAYFVTPEIGFTYFSGVSHVGGSSAPMAIGSQPNLERTTDGGQTWIKLPDLDRSFSSVSDIYFDSPGHGYVAMARWAGGIYETFDTGSHWKQISKGVVGFSGVYASNGTVFASEVDPLTQYGRGHLLYSRNDGATWDSVMTVPGLDLGSIAASGPAFEFVYGNREKLVATVCFVPDSSQQFITYKTYLVYSNDLGKTWQCRFLDSVYYWGMVRLNIPPHSCKIIRQFVGLLNTRDDTFNLLAAEDPYTAWDTCMSHMETGAWIHGPSCAQYVAFASDENPKRITFMRSTDHGVSFDSVISKDTAIPWFYEIDDIDFSNFSVVGYGAIVYGYAGDYAHGRELMGRSGYLWKTSDGGDGALSVAALAPKLSFEHALSRDTNSAPGKDTLIANCNGAIVTEIDQNLRCALTQFQDISINGLDSAEYSIVRTHHSACSSQLPDTTVIAIHPQHDTTRQLTVHAHFLDDEYVKTDTSFDLTLISKVVSGNAYTLGILLRSGPLTAMAGDTLSIPISMSILSGPTTLTLDQSAFQDFDLSLNTDLLTPLDFVPAAAGATGFVHDVDSSSAKFSLLFSKGLTLKTETLVGSLRCIVRVADTLQTQVMLSAGRLTTADTGCIVEAIPEDGSNVVVTLLPYCGVTILQDFMKSGLYPEGIQSIHPNPATSSVTVLFRNDLKRPISFELIDALGTVRFGDQTTNNEVELDVSRFSDGIYYLRAEAPGAPIMARKIVVSH